jgi:elongator complex protein 6
VKRLHLSGNGTAALDALERDITTVIKQLKTTTPGEAEEPEVLLIIDQPDLLLAATGPSKGIGATEMVEWVMGLQQVCAALLTHSALVNMRNVPLTTDAQDAHATILTFAADSPLIHNASASAHQTPLETEQAAFAIGSAHRAQMVMQLRNLETGAARDVSGVLRVSKGGACGQSDVGAEGNWEEREVLYFVQRDGGVSVFGRGE